MVSYAKFDALSRALDDEASVVGGSDWSKMRPDDMSFTAEERRAEEALVTQTLCAVPEVGAAAIIDGLRSSPAFNGCVGVVVSERLCGGERVAVELRGKKQGKKLVVKGENLTADWLAPRATADELCEGRCGDVGGDGTLWVGDCTAAALCGAAAALGDEAAARHTWPRAVTRVLRCAKELFGAEKKAGLDEVLEVDADADLLGAARAVTAWLDAGATAAVCGVEGNDRAAAVALVALALRGAALPEAWRKVGAARPEAKLKPKCAVAVTRALHDGGPAKTASAALAARQALVAICPKVDVDALDAALCGRAAK